MSHCIVYIGSEFGRAKTELGCNGDEVICFRHHSDFIAVIKQGFDKKVIFVFVDATSNFRHAGSSKTIFEIEKHYLPFIQGMSKVCNQFVYIFTVHDSIKERDDAFQFCRVLLVKVSENRMETVQFPEIPTHSWFYGETLITHDYYLGFVKRTQGHRFYRLSPHYQTVMMYPVVKDFISTSSL